MEWLHYITGPLVGAVIGYFTNDIAVKMLFYPRREVRVFGHRLPFTPGAIPKGKERLARAAGQVVSEQLMTREVILQRLLSEEIEAEITGLAAKALEVPLHDAICRVSGASEETFEAKKAQICDTLSREIAASIDVRSVIEAHGADFIRENAQGKMLSMVLTEKKCRSIADSVAASLQRKMDAEGAGYIRPILSQKLDMVSWQTPEELLAKADITPDAVRSAVTDAYRRLVNEHVDTLLARLDIAAVVTDKINAMTVEELERLVFLMMKKELNTIVRLGALIGFVLGIVNIFL